MEERGLIDSFRAVYPDPARDPGNTWSPLLPLHDGESGPAEPQDRIDFIFHKGPLDVVDSYPIVAGSPHPSPNRMLYLTFPFPPYLSPSNHFLDVDNEWTSDHRAVLTSYRPLEG